MNFELSDELSELQASVRKLAKEKVAPRARDIDRTGEYPEDLFEAFRDAGLLGLCIPTEYGGAGAGILGLTIAIEEVAKYSNTAALMLLLTRLPTGPIMIAGSEEQKHRYLTGIADGSHRAAFGLSEPQAGRDVMGMRTRATPDPAGNGSWVLNGTKCWMSGVREADWYTVFAKTGDPKQGPRLVTAFVVERILRRRRRRPDRPQDGGPRCRHRRAPARLMCMYLPENVIGEVGGFRFADARAQFDATDRRRPGHRARRGRAHVRGHLREAARGVRKDDRGLPGDPVGDRKVCDRHRGGAAAHLPGSVARRSGQVHQGMGAVSFRRQVLRDRARRAGLGLVVQLLGAAGYMEDHPTEQWYRDAKQLTIVEGTSQVQLGLVARGVLDADLWWD